MTTHALIAASPPAPALDLDARMALTLAEMDERCTLTLLAVDINTAHIEGANPVPEIAEVVPLTPTLAPTPSPYSTPLADLLHRARVYIATRGWLQGGLRDDRDVNGARCPIGAIRYEASGNRWQADDACALLLDVIQRHFDPGAETIPSWNASQSGPAPVLLTLGRAAELAHQKGR